MADFSTAIKNLEAASKGEDVRSALLALLDILINMEGDVSMLGEPGNVKGYQSYAVKSETIDKLRSSIQDCFKGFDTVPKNPSANLIKGKDLYSYFTPIINSLKKVTGLKSGDDDYEILTKDIQSLLTYISNRLYNADQNVTSIITQQISKNDPTHEAHVVIDDTVSLKDYGDKILEIWDADLDVIPLVVTEKEHTYNAPEGKAYNPVDVEIPLKKGPLVATINDKTYKPSDQGLDLFDSVTVNVPISNPNGSGGSGSKTGKDEDEQEYKLMDKAVKRNGTYTASSDGVDGYSSFDTTEVKDYYVDPNKRFTVKFEVEGKIIKEVTDCVPNEPVPSDQIPTDSEVLALHEETGDMWIFNGWEPAPYRVLQDMTCVAQFSFWNGKPLIKSSKVPKGYIEEPWNEIVKNSSQYSAGSIKPLYLKQAGFIRMMKVSQKGATSDGANSVWIAMDTFKYCKISYDSQMGLNHTGVVDNTKVYSWANSTDRVWMNSENGFVSWLPECIQNHLVRMEKRHVHTDNGTDFEWGMTRDYVWPASMKELNIYGEGEHPEWTPSDFVIGKEGARYNGVYNYLKGDGQGNLWGKPSSKSTMGKSWPDGSSFEKIKNILLEKYSSQIASAYSKETAVMQAVLPHLDNCSYNYYNTSTGTYETHTNFDLLPEEQKIIQGRLYNGSNKANTQVVPIYDMNKIYFEYPNDLPHCSVGLYDTPSGVIFNSTTNNATPDACILRDSAYRTKPAVVYFGGYTALSGRSTYGGMSVPYAILLESSSIYWDIMDSGGRPNFLYRIGFGLR